MTLTQDYVGTLTIMTCPMKGCHVVYGLDETTRKAALKDPKLGWYCTNGHSLHYPGKSEETKLREELEVEQRRIIRLRELRNEERENRRAAERSLAAQKGHNTRLRKRAANGVCPCCTRTFANVQRHVSNMHPDYVAAVG